MENKKCQYSKLPLHNKLCTQCNPDLFTKYKTTASTPENERLRGETPESERLSTVPAESGPYECEMCKLVDELAPSMSYCPTHDYRKGEVAEPRELTKKETIQMLMNPFGEPKEEVAKKQKCPECSCFWNKHHCFNCGYDIKKNIVNKMCNCEKAGYKEHCLACKTIGKCLCGLKDLGGTIGNEGLSNLEKAELTKLLPQANEWEVEFDKKFIVRKADNYLYTENDVGKFNILVNTKPIKSFITKTLADQKAKDREELEKFGTECSTNCDNFVEWKLKKYREELIEFVKNYSYKDNTIIFVRDLEKFFINKIENNE